MSEGKKKVVIVGASAAGLRCACRLRRLQPDWQITVVDAGEVFSYGACGLPYVLSGDIEELGALHRTPYGVDRDAAYFADVKSIEVLAPWRATAVDVEARTIHIEGDGEERDLGWDELVIATGASPRKLPGFPDHPRVHTFHVWDDVKPLKIGLMQGEVDHVAVVGAGLVGVELAEAFHSLWGAEVTLIEAATTPLPEILDAELGEVVTRHLESNGVRVLTRSAVSEVEADDDGVSVKAGGEMIRADAVVVAVGVVPRVELAKMAGAELGPTRAIRVDERLQTTVPHVWAAGDCVENRHVATGGPAYLPLGSLANRQGRVLADVLAGKNETFGPVAGAAAVKVFDLNVAAVGCTAARLGGDGLGVRQVWVSAEDRAHYWPEAKLILLGMVYDPSTDRVLGVQGVGEEGEVAKRIDVAAQLMLRGAVIGDFAAIEHAYAPPYAPALDPLAVLAMAAANQVDGIESVAPTVDLGRETVVDVRVEAEREERPLTAGSLHEIEVSELRDRADEIPDGPLLVACAHGTRSAEVVRWLTHRGTQARYLGGGVSWRVRALSPEG
ncbi:MAG: FAD-dependent oxidoreductase [Acidobacteria bacterium]|uniref:FAD-dependent oxidoreductase n=1 Tax=Candidatus Sulfomarinibacter kjeldsenii TaxID=2885994 RepID=A0A8J6YBL2_9BACT|nr:FAD-dependent oxidoreductase [Candidatus Sulfomarinibacter kjeldsenii]